MIAAKWFDPILGIDIHQVLVPAPPSPVPVPAILPHLFVGIVFDPMGAAIGAAIGLVLGGGGPVLVNMMPAGHTGVQVRAVSPHIPTPPGVAFSPADIPGNDGCIVMGSKTVTFQGSSEGRTLSMVMTCNFPINLPTSLCLAIPMGLPVLIGGPDAMDWMAAATQAIRTKWVSDKLHALLKLKPGSWGSKVVCFLTGHPVDVVIGQVLTDGVDFDLPGLIPLGFERTYYSRSRYDGPLGPGWHHSLDAQITEEPEFLRVRLLDGREDVQDALAVGETRWSQSERFELERTSDGYRLTYWDGRCLHFANVDGAVHKYSLIRISDRLGNQILLNYENGRLCEVLSSGGRKLAFEWNRIGKVAAVRLLGPKTGKWRELVRYEYNDEGHLTGVHDPNGNTFRYAYKGGVLVQETNRNGLNFYFEYDWHNPDGWCIRTWGDGGIYDRRLTYDKHRHMTIVDDSRGGRTIYIGNDGGLVDKKIDPVGGEWLYEWDACCRKTAEVDPLGNRTEWEYDAKGNMLLERNALGHESRWRYSEDNLPVELIDPAGHIWRHTYDRRGQLQASISPSGEQDTFEYDSQGALVRIVDALGQSMRFRYDQAGDLQEVIGWNGRAIQYQSDDFGRVIFWRDEIGRTTTMVRDAGGRIINLDQSGGSRRTFTYEPEGSLTSCVTQDGRAAYFRYRGRRKLVERTNQAGGTVQFFYDTEEQMVGVRKENGAEYGVRYDLAGRLIEERDFDGHTIRYRNDLAGRCIERIDSLGRRSKMEYDAVGHLVRRTWADGQETRYTYDPRGLLSEARSRESAVVFVRDQEGRVIREEQNGHFVESVYDANGRRILRRTSAGNTVWYRWDRNGLLQRAAYSWSAEGAAPPNANLQPPDVREIQIARNAAGQEIERRLPGDSRVLCERDAEGYPTRQVLLHREAELRATWYRWRPDARLEALGTRRGTVRFEHDDRGYLVAEHRPDGISQLRIPDAVGNLYQTREGQDRTYTPGGAVQRAGDTKFHFNGVGQLEEKVLSNGERWRYSWDSAGCLREVICPNEEKITFTYDPLGRRLSKNSAGRRIAYVWDGNDLVHELDENTPPITWISEPGEFSPLARLQGDTAHARISGFGGAPSTIVNDSGEVVWEADLDLYKGARAHQADLSWPWRWAGQYEDDETELHYNRFRYYDPAIGSYISQDPLGLAGGLNPYAYAPNPLIFIDPLGLIIVFRNLAPGENPLSGLVAKDPGRGMTPAGHIMNGSRETFKGSQFISTTTDPAVAAKWRQPGQTTVMIDTDALKPSSVGQKSVIDVSTSELAHDAGLKGRAYSNAVSSREVLLVGEVPPSAMAEVSESELKELSCK